MEAHRSILCCAFAALASLALTVNAMAQERTKVLLHAEQGGGDAATSEAVYGAIVEKLIKQNWRWPLLVNLKLMCIVELQISPDGHIQSSRLTQSSGRPDFDNSALGAVMNTESVAPPPPNGNRLELTFNSQEKL